MAWNDTKPYVTATGAPVRVGVQKIGKGNARVVISIGDELFKKIGEPDSCNVFVGDGDQAGQILIQCDEDAPHRFRLCGKGGATLKMNALVGMPQTKMKPAGVQFEELEGEGGEKQICIHLPW